MFQEGRTNQRGRVQQLRQTLLQIRITATRPHLRAAQVEGEVQQPAQTRQENHNKVSDERRREPIVLPAQESQQLSACEIVRKIWSSGLAGDISMPHVGWQLEWLQRGYLAVWVDGWPEMMVTTVLDSVLNGAILSSVIRYLRFRLI